MPIRLCGEAEFESGEVAGVAAVEWDPSVDPVGGFGVEAPESAGQVVPQVDQRPRSCKERRLHGPLSPAVTARMPAVRTRLGGGPLLGRSGAPVLRVVEVHLPGGVHGHGKQARSDQKRVW